MKVQLKANLMAFAALLAVSGVFASVQVSPAAAIVVDEKPAICHPVEGKGELKDGWNLISPNKASSHIDEETGLGKHTTKDGRTDVYAVDGVCPGEIVDADYCDPTQKPSGSIADWIPADLKCVDFTVATTCGEVTATITKDSALPYTYVVSWSEGEYELNYDTALPKSFPEDYNNGSVDVYYWLVGPEKDYVTGEARDIPNYWDGTYGMVTVDTDCETTTVPEDDDEEETNGTVVLGTSTDTPAGAGELPTSLPVTGANEQLAAIVTIVSTIATAAGVYTLRGRSADLPL